MKKTKIYNDLHGFLVANKPYGITSSAVVQRVKHLLGVKKVGHTGCLDPLATGVLILGVGEATKFSQFLLEADKTYTVTLKLGEETTTLDAEGEIVNTAVVPDLTVRDMVTVLKNFHGEQLQQPPAYSAVKIQGKPLYYYARQGIEMTAKQRKIVIYDLQLLSLCLPYVTLRAHCSKGTYVRTLASDIGKQLGCGAHVTALERSAVGPYTASTAISLEQLQQLVVTNGATSALVQQTLLPIPAILGQYPTIILKPELAFYVTRGQAVFMPHHSTHDDYVCLFSGSPQNFLGIGVIDAAGMVAPRRLINS